MSRAQIRVEANDRITIEDRLYRVTEHPALPGIPYVQRGGRGFVIQLAAPTNERMALKYFKLKYRVPELVTIAIALRQYADLPGLKAANRTVFTQREHSTLLAEYPALEYGMLMPWLPGTREGLTWYDIVTSKAPLNPPDAIRLAQHTAHILAGLKSHGLAHCDIAGANVMVDRRSAVVELVDIEEMYGAGLPTPVELPGGQDGYQHKSSRQQGQWRKEGDRFSGAVILAEMLGWGSRDIRNQSADEHYFASSELQDAASGRYKLMLTVLKEDYDAAIADLFAAAWLSNSLTECPSLQTWADALDALKVEALPATQATPPTRNANAIVNPPSPVVSGRRMIDPRAISTKPENGVQLQSGETVQPVSAVSPQSQNSASPEQASKAISSDRLKMAGIQLCRNCGAENVTGYSFCKKCGFYAGSVDQRRPLVTNIPNKTKGTVQAQSTAPSAGQIAPQNVPLVKSSQSDIISATRYGEKRIEAPPKPKEEEIPEAGFGAWLVVAIIFFMIAAVAILALTAH